MPRTSSNCGNSNCLVARALIASSTPPVLGFPSLVPIHSGNVRLLTHESVISSTKPGVPFTALHGQSSHPTDPGPFLQSGTIASLAAVMALVPTYGQGPLPGVRLPLPAQLETLTGKVTGSTWHDWPCGQNVVMAPRTAVPSVAASSLVIPTTPAR